MGNCETYAITEDNLKIAEQRMLAFTGVPIEEFNIRNVVVDDEGNYIRTFELGDVLLILYANYL